MREDALARCVGYDDGRVSAIIQLKQERGSYGRDEGAYKLTRRKDNDPLPCDQWAAAENRRIVRLFAITVMLSEGAGCMSDHVTEIASPLCRRSVVLTWREAAKLRGRRESTHAARRDREVSSSDVGCLK